MSINLSIEKRERDWYADVRGVPGTGALGPTQEAAHEGAQTTACGPIANGMDQQIECGRIPPASVQCRQR